VRRGKQPITATTAPNDQKRHVEFEWPDAQETFALLRATSALSAIKMFDLCKD
jgi:hypothetical protein